MDTCTVIYNDHEGVWIIPTGGIFSARGCVEMSDILLEQPQTPCPLDRPSAILRKIKTELYIGINVFMLGAIWQLAEITLKKLHWPSVCLHNWSGKLFSLTGVEVWHASLSHMHSQLQSEGVGLPHRWMWFQISCTPANTDAKAMNQSSYQGIIIFSLSLFSWESWNLSA